VKYPHPVDLLAVYAWGWIGFGLLGLVIAITTIVPIIGIARLLRQAPADWAGRIGAWSSLSIVAISLLQGTKSSLEAMEVGPLNWIYAIRFEFVFAISVGHAVFDLPGFFGPVIA